MKLDKIKTAQLLIKEYEELNYLLNTFSNPKDITEVIHSVKLTDDDKVHIKKIIFERLKQQVDEIKKQIENI